MNKKTITYLVSSLVILFFTITCLILHLIKIHQKMKEVSESALELSEANLKMSVPFKQELPVHQGMEVEDKLNTLVDFKLSKTILVQDSVRVQRRLKIPVEINVLDTIELKNNAIKICDSTIIYILNDTIPIEQGIHVQIPGFKKRNIPISAKIPVNQTLYIKMDDEMTTSAKIPINIPVKTEVDYYLDMNIPIEMNIPINIPIRENLAITLQDPIMINTRIPIDTEVAVDVKLEETELFPPLVKMSAKLKELSNLIWPF